MTVLRVDASARTEGSISRALTGYLVERLNDDELITRDIAAEPFPAMSPEEMMAVHGSWEGEQYQDQIQFSEKLIGELKAADTLVIGAPMYNFGVPFYLKQWIDYITRAGVTFRYTAEGPEGLTGIERGFVVTSTGGAPVGSPMDHASTYVSLILQFIGVKEIHVIDAGGSKRDPEAVLQRGREQIDTVLKEILPESA